MNSDKKPLSCDAARELMFDYIDGQLSESEKSRLEAHLSDCDGCRNELEKCRRMLALLHETELDAPIGLGERVMAAIENIPQDESESTAKILTPKKKFFVPWGTVAAACAVVMILIAGRGTIGVGRSDSGMVAEAEVERLELNAPADVPAYDGDASVMYTLQDAVTDAYDDSVVIETTAGVSMLSPSVTTSAPANEPKNELTISPLDNLIPEASADAGDSAVLILFESDFAGLWPDSYLDSFTLNNYEIIRYFIRENAEDTFGTYVNLFEENSIDYRAIIPAGAEFDECEIWLVDDAHRDDTVQVSAEGKR
ncbi:MAG: hypothetical protein E7632_01650 [Ruminococcaceae bacterium]|nr:hypothetical protein [Oscillospiraceae bacterium]